MRITHDARATAWMLLAALAALVLVVMTAGCEKPIARVDLPRANVGQWMADQ